MIQARRAILARAAVAALLLAGAAGHPHGIFAQDGELPTSAPEISPEPAESSIAATVVINAGSHTTVNNAYIGADGAASTADGSGGDENAATSGGDLVLTTDESGTGAYVGAGNGGSAESDASGGGFSSPLDPDGNPIPIAETGDNAGSSIAVGNVVAGDGTTLVEISGGDTAVAMDTSFSVSGGIADADA
ncbi:MAG: hypothetical protein IT337_08475, partial [Thermomicrobiales bacterium]|nr:hypothetical protein [Thermomicrobiales bacterium]